MKTSAEIRRANLEQLLLLHGSIAELNVALGWPRTDPKISQIKNANKRPGRGDATYQMGDAMARELEEKLGLERGWMDNQQLHSYASSDEGRTAVGRSVSESVPTYGRRSTDMAPVGLVRIPVLELSASAGPGREPADYAAVLDHIDLAEQWARKRLGDGISRIRALPVKGDSMSPTINDGDLAFVDTSCTHFEGEGVYVLVFNDALLIKRLAADFATQRILILSDNERHKPAVASEDEINICGRVRLWMSFKGY